MRITKDMVFSVDRGTDADLAQTLAVFERDGIKWAGGQKTKEFNPTMKDVLIGDDYGIEGYNGLLSQSDSKPSKTHYTPSEFLARFGSVDDAPVSESLSVLREAMDIVGGARKAEYGDQRVNFQKYADIATLMLDSADLDALACGRIPSAVVVKVLMSVKLGRNAFKPKRDNLVDLCGYADILHTVQGG